MFQRFVTIVSDIRLSNRAKGRAGKLVAHFYYYLTVALKKVYFLIIVASFAPQNREFCNKQID